jgi:hypothetical protein
MRRLAFCALAYLGLTACDNPSAPSAPKPEGRAPSYAISDGAHGGGNPGFFFLPPTVVAPSFSGAFDPGLSPTVEICALATPGACEVGPVVAAYSMTTGTDGEVVTVDPVTEHYAVKWRTKDLNLNPSVVYRISVKAGPSLLGFADVKVVSTNQASKNVDTDEFTPLVAGRILPILFRIEQGAAGPPAITVDARALSAPQATLSGMGPFSTTAVQSLTLAPGSYTLTYNAGASQPSVVFAVTSAGLVDFVPALDGVLTGRGTTTLTVAGRTIQVDATALSAPVFDVNYIIDDQPSSMLTTLTLLPGEHAVLYNAGASQPSVTFTVTPDGTLDYAPVLDGVLSGRATALLKVNGRAIQVDASALSVPVFDISYILDDQPSATVTSLTLLPGDHAILYNAGASQPSATFSVTADGGVDYSSGLDGVLNGRGSAVLKVDGRTIQVDATTLDISTFMLAFNGTFSATSIQALTLLPGAHHITASVRDFDFAVEVDGAVSYDSGLYPFLTGIGTALLTIH